MIEKNQVEQHDIHMMINYIASLGGHVTIQWVSGYMDIAGNESADKAAKKSLQESIIPDTWISTSYIKRQIPILFLIYIRFLFPKIRMAISGLGVQISSFIDDVALYVQSKTVVKNVDILQKLVKVAFEWADQNVIKFDNSKSELIHFDKSRKSLIATITLLNGIIL